MLLASPGRGTKDCFRFPPFLGRGERGANFHTKKSGTKFELVVINNGAVCIALQIELVHNCCLKNAPILNAPTAENPLSPTNIILSAIYYHQIIARLQAIDRRRGS